MQGAVRRVAILWAGFFVSSLYGGDNTRRPAPVVPASTAELSPLLAGLDSPEYAARSAAQAALAKLLESPDRRAAAQSHLRQTPWHGLSLDFRQRLSALGLPTGDGAAIASPPKAPSEQLVASLANNLASERYLERVAALEELEAAARRRSSVHVVYPALKRAAADTARPTDVRLMLAPMLDVARYTWLTGAEGRAPSPTADEIAGWIDVLAPNRQQEAAGDDRNAGLSRFVQRNAAQRELLDALALRRSAGAVTAALDDALARDDLDDDAVARLRQLREWSRPGLAVEYWQRRHNASIQYFVVGVPSQAPGAPRPTQFDHVAADFAVLASGNALRPGEYPLGVAFPHPREQAAFFHLVSLPTARERLVYQHETAAQSDAERLGAITERTLGPAVALGRRLDDAQLWLLGQLDQPTVARLLRVYFAEAPDEPFDLSQLAPMLSDVSSVHRTACLMLALDGSPAVVPALVEAARHKRFMRLSTDEPQAMAWIAALAIAARQPWDGVDEWLAGLVECADRISFGQGAYSEVGATAAALLLARRGEQTEEFGVVAREPLHRGLHDRFESPVNADYRRRMFEDRLFKQLGLTPYSFASEDGRAAVQDWWRRRETQFAPASPPPATAAAAYTARAGRP